MAKLDFLIWTVRRNGSFQQNKAEKAKKWKKFDENIRMLSLNFKSEWFGIQSNRFFSTFWLGLAHGQLSLTYDSEKSIERYNS